MEAAVVEGCAQTEEVPLEFISKEDYGNRSVRVAVSLKHPRNAGDAKKIDFSSSSFIVGSHLIRKPSTESKIYSMKLKQIADETAKLRPTPQINQLSRKMVEAKIKADIRTEEQKLLVKQETPQVKKDETQPLLFKSLRRHNSMSFNVNGNGNGAVNKVEQSVSSKHNRSQIKSSGNLNPTELFSVKSSCNLNPSEPISIKTTEKYEFILNSQLSPTLFKNLSPSNTESTANLKEVSKNLNICDRAKGWKESIQKRLEEKRQAKWSHELDGCTFKPEISLKDGLINFSGMLSTNSKQGLSKSSYGSFSSMKKCKMSSNQRLISEVNIFPCTYSQLSPAVYNVKYDRGYNCTGFMSKARPMANYQLSETEI